MKKKFAPIWRCTLFQVHIIEKLITVKLSRGYAVLKKINGFWVLGTITCKPEDSDSPVPVNIFKHIPKYMGEYFLIGDVKIPLASFSFKKKIIYFSSLPFGLIRRSYIKKIPAQ